VFSQFDLRKKFGSLTTLEDVWKPKVYLTGGCFLVQDRLIDLEESLWRREASASLNFYFSGLIDCKYIQLT
jgi:hypothetical protein